MKKFSLVLLAVLLGIFLICCGGTSPKDVVNNYFKDLKTENNDNLYKYLNGKIDNENLNMDKKNNSGSKEKKEDSEIVKESMKLISSKLEVSTGEENIDGNTATVNVTVKGVNMVEVFGQYVKLVITDSLNSAFSKEKVDEKETTKKLEEKYLQMIKEAKVEDRTGKITLTKVDDVWKIDPNDEFTQLLFGQTKQSKK